MCFLNLIIILSAFATSFAPREFPEFIQTTPHIVRGKVVKTWTDWVEQADGSKQIYTFAELKVEDVIKGKVDQKVIRIKEIGGEKDGVSFNISGAAEFVAGEDSVFMLKQSPESQSGFMVQDMMLGKLTIEKSQEGIEVLVGPAIQGDVHPHLREHDHSGAVIKKWTIDDLKKVVQEQSQEKDQKTESVTSDQSIKLLTSGVHISKKDQEEKNNSLNRDNKNEVGYKLKVYGLLAGVVFLLMIAYFKRRR